MFKKYILHLFQNATESKHMAPDALMKEVAVSLSQRRKLMDHANKLESEVTTLESSSPEKDKEKANQRSPRSASSGVSLATSNTPGTPKSAKTGSSPRRRPDTSGERKAVKNKGDTEHMESFDARLKSIITNALIGEAPVLPKTGPLRHHGKQPMSAKDYMEARTHANNMASRVMAAVDYTQMSPAKMAVQKHYSPDGHPHEGHHAQYAVGRPESDHSVLKAERTDSAPGMLSLPVKLPLQDMNTKAKTGGSVKHRLPVSIPLASVSQTGPQHHPSLQHHPGLAHHPGLPQPCSQHPGLSPREPTKTHHLMPPAHRDRVEMGKDCIRHRPGSPLMREAYSPISRPSSSSSTASAESVKHLTHGPSARTTPSGFNIDSLVSDNSRSSTSSSRTPQAPHIGKDERLTPQQSPTGVHNKVAPQLVQMVGGPGTYHNYPQLGAMLGLGGLPLQFPPNYAMTQGEKEAFMRLSPGSKQQILANHPAILNAHAQQQAVYYSQIAGLNGISKTIPTLTPDDKPKKGRRKRTASPSNAKSPPSVPPKKQTPPPQLEAEAKVSDGKGTVSRTPDIASMVSNATQPLAITAISDAESSAKSSPLEQSPNKMPTLHKESPRKWNFRLLL